MDKQQALNKFWRQATGLIAYEENSVPDGAVLPYCTYQTIIDSLDSAVFPLGHIWDKSLSWENLDTHLSAVEAFIGKGVVVALDEGRMFVCKGAPFAQRRTDENTSEVKGYEIQLQIEFFTN